jgi:hypothetical protein
MEIANFAADMAGRSSSWMSRVSIGSFLPVVTLRWKIEVDIKI